ncbi:MULTISPECIES: ExeA family protein [Pseudomonas]|uniref:ExeA family protein n=1 Tax=Pseudomonas TaxID=286 RepID=UPI0005A809DE|nr:MULTISPECIES: AAA family ATPase [Pseudomonas]AZD92023.1 Eha [Pseudomonas chlororaphis subsp. aureofaciens]KAB0531355.1 AAA family ATPase [Pseudomonas chlororaphis subsp. aureofaciens]TSD32321.1 AAA family ATPase [Pseudomonas sp. ATCC 13985]WDG62895.1 AAA family ATPase [Pseudomonas chlororaphis]WDG69162.1 AAA family ATPase [Pseudomonas chlororaphis]
MLKLKQVLQGVGRPQAALAESLSLSEAAVAQLLNHGQWPRSLDSDELQGRIRVFLTEAGANDADIANAFEEVDLPCANTADPAQVNEPSGEDEPMLLPKQTLQPNTRKAFGLFRDPFDELQSAQDMWVSPDIRYVREIMYQTARHGGFLAVVGESGAGKSTLRRDLVNRIAEGGDPVIIIEPYVLASEDNDTKGKSLKSTHIAESMMAAVAPLAKPKSSPEARFAQLHKALKESHAAGYRHCLVIEEAHSLPIPTLKHLKRILELEVGFTKLVSIIMIGQPELDVKLSERNADVREVVQRCERVTLAPIEGSRLEEFLRFRFDRAGKAMGEVIDASGIQALAERLSQPSRRGGRDENVSLLYPLAIGNLVIAAMNLAAQLGVPMITADVVKGV